MRMAGQMGNETATILNLEVLEILAEDNAVVVSGAVPGPDGALLAVHHAARPRKRSNVKVTVSA
jgi:large subunit ribosomal protein L3